MLTTYTTHFMPDASRACELTAWCYLEDWRRIVVALPKGALLRHMTVTRLSPDETRRKHQRHVAYVKRRDAKRS